MDADLSPSSTKGLITGGSVVGGIIALVLLIICCCCSIRTQKSATNMVQKSTQKSIDLKTVDATSSGKSERKEEKNCSGSSTDVEVTEIPTKKVRFYCEGDKQESRRNVSAVAATNLPPYAKIRKDTASIFYMNATPQ